MREFRGRVAVVTGAASGIGRALAGRFAREGMRLVLADVEQTALDRAERELVDGGAETLALRVDVSRPDQVQELARRTVERFGGVHVVCNNAGVGGGGAVWQQPLEDWRWVLGVNLWGVIHGVHAFVPTMLERGEEGHIVNTASMAGLLAGPGMGSYNVSKFGVVALSETLHHELKAAGGQVKVSVLCPGWVNTQIDNSGRNRPDGPLPPPAEGSPEAAMRLMMRRLLETGLDPDVVADHVFEAIQDERFYILTHREYEAAIRARAEAILAGREPVTPGFV